jgi:hypothetical protein
MQNADVRLLKSWEKIAARASKETDLSKLGEAVRKIHTALKVYEESQTLNEWTRSDKPLRQ